MVSIYLNRHCGPRFIYIYIYILYLKSMYIYIYRIQKFWGHMLQRHSNPTKNKVWWPRQTKLLVGFGLRFLRVFMGLDEFLQVCDVFFRGLWRSCFIKNLVLLTKTCFFSQKTTQNKVLIPRPVFFRDLVDVGYKYNIFISIYRYLTSI